MDIMPIINNEQHALFFFRSPLLPVCFTQTDGACVTGRMATVTVAIRYPGHY